MKLPPRWKVRRELLRIREQFGEFVRVRTDWPIRAYLHDLNFARAVRRETGDGPQNPLKVAIFIIFQPKGVAESTFLTLAHLRENGYGVIFVANGVLSDGDAQRASQYASLLVRRPNIGYDFGAYRDGLRVLGEMGWTPERIVLMNDSTWFPLRAGDSTLSRMEVSGAGLTGHIFKTESRMKAGHDHLESHLLMFTASALAHPEIRKFWKSYRMTDSRTLTIERGEKRLTQTALRAGVGLKGLLSRETFLEILRQLDDAALLEALDEIVHHKDEAKAYCAGLKRLALAGEPWRDEFLGWVDVELQNSLVHLLSATFCFPAFRHGEMGFVKKARDIRFHGKRKKVLQLAQDGLIAPLAEAVVTEIKASIEKWEEPVSQPGWREQFDKYRTPK